MNKIIMILLLFAILPPLVIRSQNNPRNIELKWKTDTSKQVGSVTVFYPLINNKTLTFKQTIDGFADEQTGSNLSIAGKCIKGQYLGSELQPMIHGNHFAFAWFAFHPECEIYGQ